MKTPSPAPHPSLWHAVVALLFTLLATTSAHAQGGPAFTNRLFDQTVYIGQTAVFTAVASGDPAPTYKWYKNGGEIPGATSSTFSIPNAQVSDVGFYHAMAFNVSGTATSTVAQLSVVPAPVGPFARIVNASVRATLPADIGLGLGYTLIGGPKPILVRAVGPSLGKFDVANAMPDPRLELNSAGAIVATNDDWGDAPELINAFAATGAFSLFSGSKDAALIRTSTGGHTAQVSGNPGGNVMVELYDAGTGLTSRLVNFSVLSHVGIGANVLIVGLTISGDAPQPIAIRAVGPGLAPFNVGGRLEDPKLEVFSATQLNPKIAENDDWSAAHAGTFSRSGAFSLPENSKDAGVVLTLAPGGYTVQVSGVGGTTGLALVEVYEVPVP